MDWQRVLVKACVGAALVFLTTWAANGSPDTKSSLAIACIQAAIAFLTDVQAALKEPAGRPMSLKDKLLKLARYA
jgi:hypothetical protein